MASISINIDTRRATNAGTYPLKICISHNYKKAYIPTGIKLRADQWKNGQIVNHPQRVKLNSLIRLKLADLEQRLFMLGTSSRIASYSAYRLRNKLLIPEEKQGGAEIVKEWFEKKIEDALKPGTKRLYSDIQNKLINYCKSKGIKYDELEFEDITTDTLRDMNKHFEAAGNSINTRADFFGRLSSIYNYAIKHNALSADIYPFRLFKLKKERTVKRSLTPSELKTLFNSLHSGELNNEAETYAIKFLLLSFLLIGINPADIYVLTPDNIDNNRLHYNRAKTGRLYDILIQPEALALINELKAKKGPLLFEYPHRYKSAQIFATNTDRLLAKISTRLIGKGISFYWARHSWATIAAELEIPKETISAALGHGSQNVTDVYINFNIAKVDKANRDVIDYVYNADYKQKP